MAKHVKPRRKVSTLEQFAADCTVGLIQACFFALIFIQCVKWQYLGVINL